MKNAQRQAMLRKRLAFVGKEKIQADAQIQSEALRQVRSLRTVGLYLNRPDEVSTANLASELLKRNILVVAPRCEGSDLVFSRILETTTFKPGPFNIPEPCGEPLDKNHIEAILVPLIAFDRRGYRIGFGKGYYDRYLSDYCGTTIGLAYSFQEV